MGTGCVGYGNSYDFGNLVNTDYHTFAIEWSQDEIHWCVDGVGFHNATPSVDYMRVYLENLQRITYELLTNYYATIIS